MAPSDIPLLRRNIFENYGLSDMDSDMTPRPTYSFNKRKEKEKESNVIDPRTYKTTGDGNEPTPKIRALMDELGTFDTTEKDALHRLIQAMPTRNTPGIARNIVAGGIGLGSKDPVKSMEEVMYAPYNRQAEDWAAKIDPQYKAAQLENTANANERAMRSSLLTAQTAQANIASREKMAAEKLALQREKDNGAQISIANGHAVVHRQDGTVYEAPVDLTNYTALEIAQLTAKAAQQRVETQGQTARDVADIRANAPQVFNIYGANPNAPPTAQVVRPGTGTASPVISTQTGEPVGQAQRPTGAGAGLKQPNPVDLKSIQDKAQEVLGVLGKLIDDKDQFTGPGKAYYGGGGALGMGSIPFTDARTGKNLNNQLHASLIISLIGDMKNQSRTGATGFGQLSRAELAVLERSAANLDPAQDPEVTRTELMRIREKLKKILLPADGENPTVTQPRTQLQQAIDDALGVR